MSIEDPLTVIMAGSLNFLKCVLLIITGRLSDDLPAIFNSNYSTLEYWRDEWKGQDYSDARVNAALIQAQRWHLKDHASKQYDSIISQLHKGFTWEDLYWALYEAFFNDAYKSYQQAKFQNTPNYDSTKGPLSKYLNTLFNDLTRAGVDSNATLDIQFKSKLTGDALNRWRNHISRPGNEDIPTALRNLTAEDELSFTPVNRKRRADQTDSLDDRLGPKDKKFYTGGGACRLAGHFFAKTKDGKHKSYHLWRDCSDNPANRPGGAGGTGGKASNGNGTAPPSKKFTCLCGSPEHKFAQCPKKAAILKAAASIGTITETIAPVQETLSDSEMDTFSTPQFNALEEADPDEDLDNLFMK